MRISHRLTLLAFLATLHTACAATVPQKNVVAPSATKAFDVPLLRTANSPRPVAIEFVVTEGLQPKKIPDFDGGRQFPEIAYGAVEASACEEEILKTHAGDPVLEATRLSFAYHRTLTLAPDDLWLLILRGVDLHVSQNPEALRGKLVSHAEKIKLEVRRDGFVKGDPRNDWQGVFAELSNGMRPHLHQEWRELCKPFSTTDATAHAAFHVAVMSTMQSYFKYEGTTFCGIPRIRLLGKPEDWTDLRRRIQPFKKLGMTEWVDAMDPALAQFEAAAHGRVDAAFWQGFYKLYSVSGSSKMTGHVLKLFPYVIDRTGKSREGDPEKYKANPYLKPDVFARMEQEVAKAGDPLPPGPDERSVNSGVEYADIPSRMSSVPFLWHYLWTDHRMRFVAGHCGIACDAKDPSVRPVIGWRVYDEDVLERGMKKVKKTEEEVNQKETDTLFEAPDLKSIFEEESPPK